MSYDQQFRENKPLVLARDDFTCQQCGEKTDLLDIHHIIPLKRSGTNSVNNLIALCRSCHKKIEPRFQKNDKPLKYEKFLMSVGVNTFNIMQNDSDKNEVTVQEFIRNVIIPFYYQWKDKVVLKQ